MSEHTITITLKDGRVRPVPPASEMSLGDTVVYVTDPPNLPFRVEFDASPFTREPKLTITDNRSWTVSERGKFFSRCFVTGPDGEVGWAKNGDLLAGGEHDVRP